MLKIRLSRTGKRTQPSFRLVVAEQSNAVKGKYLELLGHYVPALNPKQLDYKKDRIEYWISKGAQPSDTVAGILKREGFKDMDKYLDPKDKKRRKKKGGDEPAEAPAAAPKEAAAEKPAEAPAAAPKEAAAEKPADAPAKEEAPAEAA